MVVMEETSHSVWVNSAALQLLGITSTTPDPIGGHIFKDPFSGEPDGILMDNAGDVVLSAALASNAIIDSLNYDGLVNYSLPLLAENGITSICEARTYWKRNYIPIWEEIKTNNLLTVRVILAPWVYPDDDDASQISMLQSLYDEGDNMLKISQIKLYSDGITINATAALHEPYNDNLGLPFNTGLNYIEVNRLTNLITTLEQTGYDFHIHTIGDRGVTEAIDAIENARNANGDIGARHRLTHLEIVDTADYSRFAPLNITADVQVAGDFTNPEHWHDNDFLIGFDRSENMIPLKSIFNTGARVTLSSDWDVSWLNPFVSIQNALTRAPQELPTVEDAVKAYTINGAYTMRQETITGSIEVGKLADFICVDQDIFTVPLNQIGQTTVLCTHLSGVEIYRSSLLSVNEKDSDAFDFKLFPNPSNQYIRIDISGLNIDSVMIYSIKGDLIERIELLDDKTIQVDLSNYNEGIYLVKLVLVNGKFLSAKFVKG
jgi:predicted amidohydrolase YtcJ